MIDFTRLAGQLGAFTEYQREEQSRHIWRLETALECLEACAPTWQSLAEQATAGSRGPLRAIPMGPPNVGVAGRARPDTVTVVATDGSQIFPDRHADPACYLLNIGRVALHYGTLDPPFLASEPDFRYARADLDPLDEEQAGAPEATAEVVSALRDEKELEWLHRTAIEQRRSGREIVALADGTLIRWMLRGMKNRRVEAALLARYVDILDRFQADGVPLASYVSRPGSAEVVNLLRLHRGEPDWEHGPTSLHGLLDRHVYERVLAVGERTVAFESRSEVLQAYGPHRVVAFYVRLSGEVARVEMPQWAAVVPGWLDLVHAVLSDQVEKGAGYPIVLQEAHERAVVRAEEREMFFRLLQSKLRRDGLTMGTSAKDASKRVPRI